MLKVAAPTISPADTAILKGILDGFGEVVDINKVEKFNSEVKRIFERVKVDSQDLPDASLYQIAFHMAKNRAKHISEKKGKEVEKETPPEVPAKPAKPATEEKFVQPIVRRNPKEQATAPTIVTPIVEPTVAPFATSTEPEILQEIVPSPLPSIAPYEPPPESRSLTIRRAISDGLDIVEGINTATTTEHLYDEAQKLYAWYLNKFDQKASAQEVYETVFNAAKKVAEDIVAAHKILVEKDVRKDMRAKRKEEAEQAEAERQRIAEIAKIELKELIAKMLQEKDLSNVTKEALKYFKLIYLDDKRDPEVVHLFPGTSRDQRYQWKSRAVRMIAPYASEDARKYIGEKTKRKFAFAPDVLLKAAQMFFNQI